MPLPEEKRQQLDDIVQRMVVNKEPENVIQGVVADFKSRNEAEVQGQKKNPLMSLARGITGFFGGQKIGEAIGAGLAKSPLSKAITGLDLTPEEKAGIKGPSALQVLGDVGQVGLTLGTLGAGTLVKGGVKAGAQVVAKGLARRTAESAALGAGFGATRSLAEEGKIDPGTVLGGALAGGALPGVGKALSFTGKQLTQALPKRLMKSVIKQPLPELLAGKDVSGFALSRKKVGTLGGLATQSARAVETLGQQIDKNLVNPALRGQRIDIRNIYGSVMEKENARGAALTKKAISEVVDELSPQARGLLGKKVLTLRQANQLRSSIDRTLGDRGFLVSQQPFKKDILRAFTNGLREAVKSKAPEGTREIFGELSKEITLRDAFLTRMERESRNLPVGLLDVIVGAGAFGPGGILGSALAVAAKKALMSTPATTGAAVGLDVAGKALSPILQQLAPAERTAILKLFTSFGGTSKPPESGNAMTQ